MLRFWSVFLSLGLLSAASLAAAQVQIHASSQDNLALSVYLNDSQQPQPTALGTARQAALIDLPLPDNKYQPAAVVPFILPPGKDARLVTHSLSYAAATDKSLLQQSLLQAGAAQITLSEPVSVRGLRIAKLYIPQVVAGSAGLQQVERAEVALEFVGQAAPAAALADSPFNRMLSQTVANWTQGRRWGQAIVSSLAADDYDPFSYSSNWVQISIPSNGLYSINRTDLATAGVAVATIDPATFRVFTLGGMALPREGKAARDSLAEIAILVEDDDDLFAGDDRIVFAATGPDFWYHDDGVQFNHNPYNNANIYYLTWGGSFPWEPRRMGQVAVVDPPTDTLTRFVDYIHLEENNSLGSVGGEIDDYFTWYWKTDSEFTLNFNLPTGVNGADNILILSVDGTVESAILNTTEGLVQDSLRRPHVYYTTDNLQTGLNQLELSVGAWFGMSFTDYLEMHYQRPLTKAPNSELVCYASADALSGSPAAYRVGSASGTRYVIDITDLRGQRAVPFDIDDGATTFSSLVDGEGGRIFLVAAESDLKSPAQVLVTDIDDLRSPSNAADLVIITHSNFYNQALDFAQYRRQHDNIRVRVVEISDLYAQFSGGLVDPVAIRDFLGHAFRNWSGAAPSYCLLVGDGVYDFRDHLGTGSVNYIPPYIVPDDETVSDENYVYFDQLGELDSDNSFDTSAVPIDRGADMVIARWPVSSAAEFTVVAEKMENYEAGENFGSWRNRITLIADDENHPNSLPERQHTEDSETLADNYIPPQFDLNKIYSVDYPFGTGGQKPEVREAIIRTINSGTLIANYVGHGNPNVWADERIFRRTQDIPRLSNRDQLPLIFNASCSIGFFDDPLTEGMAEDFLSYAAGGAIGTVSATRLVYSRPNAEFNKTAFYYLLGDYDFTVTEATYVTKLVRQDLGQVTNDRKYIYIGDPLTKLGFAPLQIEFDTFAPDSLVALTVTELAGVIRDEDGVLQSSFGGTVEVSVFDNERERAFQFPPFTDTVTYTEYGPSIYRGKVEVVDGRFEMKFVVPKDITYGGRSARISGYANDGVSGAAGYIYPIPIGGINTEVADTTGPDIVAYFADDPTLVDGANVTTGTKVTIELFDSLGINLTGEIGHTLDLLIDDDPSYNYVLNDSFTYIPGSYQKGAATMRLPELTSGAHNLKIKAWDSANNSSRFEIAFNVGERAGLEISDLLCYPNPVREDCEFSYYLSRAADDVTLKIFTVSGLEIFARQGLPGEAGYHGGVRWSGFDADGDRPANGVYIFQLSAQALDSIADVDDKKVTANEKLIIMK